MEELDPLKELGNFIHLENDSSFTEITTQFNNLKKSCGLTEKQQFNEVYETIKAKTKDHIHFGELFKLLDSKKLEKIKNDKDKVQDCLIIGGIIIYFY
jgi:hypothetical protein